MDYGYYNYETTERTGDPVVRARIDAIANGDSFTREEFVALALNAGEYQRWRLARGPRVSMEDIEAVLKERGLVVDGWLVGEFIRRADVKYGTSFGEWFVRWTTELGWSPEEVRAFLGHYFFRECHSSLSGPNGLWLLAYGRTLTGVGHNIDPAKVLNGIKAEGVEPVNLISWFRDDDAHTRGAAFALLGRSRAEIYGEIS